MQQQQTADPANTPVPDGLRLIPAVGSQMHRRLLRWADAYHLIVFVFGVFKLRLRTFFVLTFVAGASYGTSMLLLAAHAL